MRKIYYLIAIAGFFSLAFFISAQEKDPFADITYPVSALGNCQSKADCEVFCNKPDNMPACLDFAKAHNLMSEKDIGLAKKMLELGETQGPGGCKGQAQCETYCDDISNIKECVAFAEKNNLIPPDELAETKKIAAAIEKGITPPPCKSKSECDQICRKPENMKTCVAFAKEAGLMSEKELAEVEKVLSAVEKGAIPPPCGGKEECDDYCAEPQNLEQCLTFAEAAGFISPEDAAMARKTGGKGPGDCRGKEQCESYCDDPANAEKCINFAAENGFMSAEDAAQAKKMMAAGMNVMKGGPGGCKGQEECKNYCDDSSHSEECLNFAVESGMMPAEEVQKIREMKQDSFQEGAPSGERPEGQMPPAGGMTRPPSSEEIQKMIEQGKREHMEGTAPSEGIRREGMPEGIPSEEFQQEMQRRIQEETQHQIQQQIQQPMQQQMEQQIPQQTQQMMSPSSEGTAPAPVSAPAPETQPTSKIQSLLGIVIAPFLELFR